MQRWPWPAVVSGGARFPTQEVRLRSRRRPGCGALLPHFSATSVPVLLSRLLRCDHSTVPAG